MTFRPSDDVLDEIESNQSSSTYLDQNSVWNQDDWQHIFGNLNNWENVNSDSDTTVVDIVAEEVKAPDLSELLKDNWKDEINNESQSNTLENSALEADNFNKVENLVENKSESMDQSWNNENISQNQQVANKIDSNQEQILWKSSQSSSELNVIDDWKISDMERSKIVSSIPGSINSNLDFLVDDNWLNIIEKYIKFNRLFFRWWIFVLIVIVWILSWMVLQVKANRSDDIKMLSDSSIENKNKWIENTSDKILQPLIESGVDIDVIVPYGSASFNWKSINSKSNLVIYRWIVLPQLSSVDFNSDGFISLEDFNNQKLTRQDIKNFIDTLIIKDSIYKNTRNLPNISDNRWIGNVFQWLLVDGFNLSCLNNDKVSDFVCDKFLETFYDYGKYYDLTQYWTEILDLVTKLRRQWKDINPICDMVKEYTLHTGRTPDTLNSVMQYCGEDDVNYYKKMSNFIELENSLWQPELSIRVFDDPDLNAYKLLSAQQSVYKILDGTSLNESYIKSYLKFVQSLIDKDKGSNRYLHPIYKDLLYVFNKDELEQKLMQKWKLSSDLKLQIDQINNWNTLWSLSLLSQLTIPDIVQVEQDFTGLSVWQRSIEDLFSQYYTMNDRLRIRKADIISDDNMKVQTELFTDSIEKATGGESLKVVVMLRRQDNILYVDNIKIANQTKFTDILNIYLSEWNVTFYAMLNYIDDQVWMWYESEPEVLEEQPNFCEEIKERSDITIYDCDETSISLYKWEVEYNFVLVNWVLDSFTISDANLEQIIKRKLDGVLFMKDSTPSIITSIIDYTVEVEDGNLEKKLEIINQFRIHFKLVPDDIHDIQWKSNEFLIDFTLWEFKLQGRYNIDTHLLSKIYFTNCEKNLEIRQLTLEITSENETQLIEILNNPRVFFARFNPSIYKKYQKVCWWTKNKN